MDNAVAMKAQAINFRSLLARMHKKIARPVLLVAGEKSHKMLHAILKELKHCLPNSKMAVIPGASHNMHIANPQAFNEVVLDFLAKARSPVCSVPVKTLAFDKGYRRETGYIFSNFSLNFTNYGITCGIDPYILWSVLEIVHELPDAETSLSEVFSLLILKAKC